MIKKQLDPEMTKEQFIALCQETLNTARTIEALLRGLNNGYDESLQALQNLKKELEKYINDFRADTEQLEIKLNTAKQEIAKVLEQIEEIKPKIEQVYELSQQTQASMNRLEEINVNVTQIEQRIRELIKNINIDELENFGNKLRQDLENIKNEKIADMQKALDEAIRVIEDSFSEIEKRKEQALKEIQEAAGSGWVRVLQECIITKAHALSTLSLKIIDRDKFDRIGMVVNFSARTRKMPIGYVKPNTFLSVKEYSLLYFLSGVSSENGMFKIELPDATDKDYIYAGKDS